MEEGSAVSSTGASGESCSVPRRTSEREASLCERLHVLPPHVDSLADAHVGLALLVRPDQQRKIEGGSAAAVSGDQARRWDDSLVDEQNVLCRGWPGPLLRQEVTDLVLPP